MLGFIGAGNMASAIIKGLISSDALGGEEIGVFDIDKKKCEALSALPSVRAFDSERALAEASDKIVFSVKPNIIKAVADKIKDILEKKNPLIISIAAGKTIAFITECLGYQARVVRVMPNINALVSSAVSAYCPSEFTQEGDADFVRGFCNSFGISVEIKEELFSVYSAIAGCSPAFSYMFIDSLARAAVKEGMPKDMALEVAAGAVLGSAKMILESDEHPWQLVDRVCSPGGTTIEGVAALQQKGFEDAVASAVKASAEKDRLIAGK